MPTDPILLHHINLFKFERGTLWSLSELVISLTDRCALLAIHMSESISSDLRLSKLAIDR
jgi:hypothetical protein